MSHTVAVSVFGVQFSGRQDGKGPSQHLDAWQPRDQHFGSAARNDAGASTGQCSRPRHPVLPLPLPPSTRCGMTVLSSSGETLPQRSARREASVRSQWNVLVKDQHGNFQERWLASAPASSSSSSSSSSPTHRPLRSLHFATSLGSLDSSPLTWASRVKEHRNDYARKRRKVLRAPDGTLPQGIEEGTADEEQGRTADWTVNNPLSLDEQVCTDLVQQVRTLHGHEPHRQPRLLPDCLHRIRGHCIAPLWSFCRPSRPMSPAVYPK